MKKSVTITSACNTVQGDRFPGDQYSGDGTQNLVNLGVATWNDENEEVVPDVQSEISDDDSGAEGSSDDDTNHDDGTGGSKEPTDQDSLSDKNPQESGSGGGRVYCQIEGCKKYKLEPCPECTHPTCSDHMDKEAGKCRACVQESEMHGSD